MLDACDALDGAKDGVLENPLACTFDPKVLACKDGGDPASCLTTPQVTAVQKIYAGASNPRTGAADISRARTGQRAGMVPVPVGYAVDYFKYIVFKDPAGIRRALNFDAHVAQAATGDNLIFDATKDQT